MPTFFEPSVVSLLFHRSAAIRAEPLPPVRTFLLDLGVQLLKRLAQGAEPLGFLRPQVVPFLRVGLQVVELEGKASPNQSTDLALPRRGG